MMFRLELLALNPVHYFKLFIGLKRSLRVVRTEETTTKKKKSELRYFHQTVIEIKKEVAIVQENLKFSAKRISQYYNCPEIEKNIKEVYFIF